jgi:hypothetical protein
MHPSILDAFPKRDREVVLSFLSLSSRKARSAEEVTDSLCLSISLTHALRDVPN